MAAVERRGECKFFTGEQFRSDDVFDRIEINTQAQPAEEAAFSAFAPPRDPGAYELFDVDADPGETKNLAAALPGQKNKMLPLMIKVRRQIAAAAARQGNTGLDAESRRQLEALGYL